MPKRHNNTFSSFFFRNGRITGRRGRRKGIGSIIGTLFFVLIAIIVLGIFITIFNSFSSYVQTFEGYSQQSQLNQETDFSLTSMNFAVPNPTLTGPSTVSTTTTQSAVEYSPQNKLIYADGLWWVFFSTGSGISYETSSTGTSWSAATSVTTSATSTTGMTFSIWLSGTTLYYVLSNAGSTSSFRWRYGTISASGTISWTISETAVTTAHTAEEYDAITVDGSGNVWVALLTYKSSSSTYYLEVWKYSGGTWTSEDAISGATVTSGTMPDLEPVTSGIVLIYGEAGSTTNTVTILTTATGATWSTAVSPASYYAMFYSSAISVGNTIYFVGLASGSTGSSSGTVDFWSFTYGASSTSAQTVISSTSAGWYTSIAQANSNTFIIYYGSGVDMYYVFSTDGMTNWSSQQTISTGESSLVGISSSNTGGGLVWVSGSSSPYNVRFAAVTASTQWQVTPTFQNNSPFAVQLVSFYLVDTTQNLLVAHWDVNSSGTDVTGLFSQWVGAGQSVSTTLTMSSTWTHSDTFLATVTTNQGVIESGTYTAPS